MKLQPKPIATSLVKYSQNFQLLLTISSPFSISSVVDLMRDTVHYWVYGIILLFLVIFSIWMRPPSVRHIHEPPAIPATYELLPSAYCTSSSIHANCFFSRSLCYNINSTHWETSSLPFFNWTGVSLRARGSLFRDSLDDSKCNNPFLPKFHSTLPNNTYWVNGTSVLSCVWINVFGHIFLEIMLPAWMAMRNLADRLHFSDQNITYILDDRRFAPLASMSFSLLSHQPVLQFADLVHEGKKHGKSHICFDRLIVGYRLQSSLEFAHNVAHLENGDLARYRDTIKKLHGLPLKVNMSAGACIALLVQRAHNRRIMPESEKEIVKMLRERTLCTVQIATFDGISILDQVRLVANATIFVHVSGSGSHQFIWLPDGAASLAIVHPHLGLNVIGNGAPGGGGLVLNEFLCWRHPTVLCVTAGSNTIGANAGSHLQVDTYSFSNALDMITLWQHRGKFDPRDPSE